MMHVTVRWSSAIRTARSTRWRICAGSVAISTNSCATSLNSETQVDLLLVAAAERAARLLADDRDHRLMIELGVVEAVQQVDRARAGRRQADADLARELRMAAGHERRHLLVAHLDELRVVRRPGRSAPMIALIPSPG